MLSFRLHPLRSGRFCGNPLPSFGVSPVLRVAPLGVSVLPLHASLSACNRDMPSTHSSAQTAERRHSQPHAEVPTDQSLQRDFYARLSRVFTGGVSCLDLNTIARHIGSHSSHDLSRGFSARMIVILSDFLMHKIYDIGNKKFRCKVRTENDRFS